MAKTKTMLDHMIANLDPARLAKLTDVAQRMFPDVVATFSQRPPNMRETWIMGLMAGHTWQRYVLYKEFYETFRIGALTDTYHDATCRRILDRTLDVCCQGWELITQDGALTIYFPSLEDVRESCEIAFGKTSWLPTDEVAMIPIREAEEAEAKEAAKKAAYDEGLLRSVMERRDALLPTGRNVMKREREIDAARAGPRGETLAAAQRALEEAVEAHRNATADADIRQSEQIRCLKAAMEAGATSKSG